MATTSVFVPRYANAFASVVTSAGLDAAAAQRQMEEFAALLDESWDLREVLMDPSIPSEQKLAVLDALTERLGLMREVRNFVAVILDHHRLGEFKEIVAAYADVADVNRGVTEADVTSARELAEDDRHALEARIATLAGTAVRVTYGLDSALLGGAVVKIRSTVYDGSVRAQLKQLRETLMSV